MSGINEGNEQKESLVDNQENQVIEGMDQENEDFSEESQKEDLVAYSSHKKVLNQYKTSKKRERELAERLAQLEAEREQAEKTRLEERQEYKKLYENQLDQNKKILAEISAKEQALVDDHKRRALEKELGGLKKSEYFKFANLEDIVIADDGTVDLQSVKFEANRYRQEYPELITQQKQVFVNNQAPSNDGVINKNKSAHEMTEAERAEFKRKQIQERLKAR